MIREKSKVFFVIHKYHIRQLLKTTLSFLLFFILSVQIQAAVIWEENFDALALDQKGATGNTINMVGVTKWSIDVSAATLSADSDWFRVQNQQLEARDPDGDVIWESESIDISSYNNVQFKLDANEEGDLEGNSGINTDYFDVYYSIDSGTYNLIANWSNWGDLSHTLLGDKPDDNDWMSTIITQAITAGSSSLKLKVVMRNSAGNEYIRLDNVIVEGDLKQPAMTVSKTADPVSISSPGNISYQILIKNTGNISLTNVVPVDTMPDGTAGALVGPMGDANANDELDVAETWTYTSSYAVAQDDIDAGNTLRNSIKISTTEIIVNDIAETSIIQMPAFTMIKTADPAVIMAPGNITYTFTFKNTGNVNLTNLTVSDANIDSALVCNNDADTDGDIDVLGLTQERICTATRAITQAQIDAGTTLTNNATSIVKGPDGTTPVIEADITDNSTSTPVTQIPAFTMIKTADPAAITTPGDITYTFTFKNTGNVSLTNLTVNDANIDSALICNNDVDTDGDIDMLGLLEEITCTATRTITQAQIDAGIDLINTATPSATAPDGSTSVTEDNTLNDNSTVTTVTQTPEIGLAKTATAPTTAQGVNPDLVDPGDTITYTLVATNNGNVTLHNVSITDTLITPSCTATSSGDTFLNDGSDTLDVGESVTCTAVYTLTQSDINTGGRDNTATVNALDPSDNPISDSDTVESPLAQKTSLDLLKTAGIPTVIHGLDATTVDADDTVSYTFDIKNTGNVTLTNIIVSDLSLGVAPFNMAVDCGAGTNTIASLAANATHQCTAIYTLIQDDIDGFNAPTITNTAGVIELANTAKVTGTPPADSGLVAPVAQSSSKADAQITAAISLEKIAGAIADIDNDGVNSVGDEITYTYTITNKGVTTLKDVKVIEEVANFTGTGTLPTPGNEASTNVSGLSTDAVANDGIWDRLAPGDVVIFSAIYALTQADIDAGNIGNEAEATGTPPAGMGTPTAESSVVKPINQKPALSLNKSADNTQDVVAGQTITYSYVVTNTGNVTINDIAVTDIHQGLGIAPVPSGGATTLAPGDSTTFASTYIVTQADIDKGISIINTATADGTPAGGSLSSVNDNESIDLINQAPALTLVKIMSANADQDGSNSITLGDTLTYKITATNNGNVTLNNVTVSDNRIAPSSANCATLELAASCELVGTYSVTQADVDAGKIDNIASATTPDIASIPDVEVSTPITQQTSAVLSKVLSNNADQDGSNSITLGDTLTYTVVVKNTGNTTLSTVTVTDNKITPNSKICATLAPIAECKLVGTYSVTQADVDAGKIDNIASATTPDIASIPDVQISTPITQQTSAVLTKVLSNNADQDGSNSITLGDTLTYTIVVKNTGNTTLSTVTVTDNKITPNSITCATLVPTAECKLVGTYSVTQADVDAGKIDNIASATTPDITSIPDVNITTPVASQKSLSLDKTMIASEDLDNTNSITAGDILTYEIVATNTGTVILTNLVVTDPLITPTSKTCMSVAPGSTCVLSGVYTVNEADATAGKRENTATANSDQTELTSANTTVTIHQPQLGSIRLVKTGYSGHNDGQSCGTTEAKDTIVLVDDKKDEIISEPVTYCFEITNTDAGSYLTDIQITDATLGKNHADFILLNGPTPVALEPGASLLYYIQVNADSSLTNIANVVATPSDDKGDQTGLADSVTGTDSADVTLIVDPPSAFKTVTPSGTIGMQWQMVWINTSVVAAPDVFIYDEIPEGTHFEAMPAGAFVSASGVYCEARGTSTTTIAHDDNCYYEAPSGAYPRGRVIWKGIITSDAGNDTEDTANNEVVIRFISVLDNPALPNQEIKNQGHSEWDYNHNGKPDITVPTDNPDTGEDDDDTVFKPINAIPTLSEWMLILLSLLLFIIAKGDRMRYLRL